MPARLRIGKRTRRQHVRRRRLCSPTHSDFVFGDPYDQFTILDPDIGLPCAGAEFILAFHLDCVSLITVRQIGKASPPLHRFHEQVVRPCSLSVTCAISGKTFKVLKTRALSAAHSLRSNCQNDPFPSFQTFTKHQSPRNALGNIAGLSPARAGAAMMINANAICRQRVISNYRLGAFLDTIQPWRQSGHHVCSSACAVPVVRNSAATLVSPNAHAVSRTLLMLTLPAH
jgi:hypothetical protein